MTLLRSLRHIHCLDFLAVCGDSTNLLIFKTTLTSDLKVKLSKRNFAEKDHRQISSGYSQKGVRFYVSET